MPVKINVPVKLSWIHISVYPVCKIIIHVKALERLRKKKGKYEVIVFKSHVQK